MSVLVNDVIVVKGEGARVLCPQSNWDVCPRWNGVPLVCYMQGLSGYNTENLTTNHSGTPCWERCHVPRTLKNPAVVFSRSRNHRRLNCPTLPTSPYFQWQSKFVDPIVLVSVLTKNMHKSYPFIFLYKSLSKDLTFVLNRYHKHMQLT